MKKETIIRGLKKRAIILAIYIFVLMWVPLAVVRMVAAIVTNPDKAWNILKGWDRLGNVHLNGKDTEMISTRAARAKREKRRWGCVLCKILDEFEKGHCDRSVG